MKSRFNIAADYVKTSGKTVFLHKDLWKENSTALLQAPRETDKTALALDIAVELTEKDHDVFYLTTQRLDETHKAKIASNTRLYVHTPEFASPDDSSDYADIVIADIEEAIATTPARIFIVDSITRIAALSFGRNASPTYIMKRLVALQVRHKISLLVVAHSSTKATDKALTNLSDDLIAPDSEQLPDSAPAPQTDAVIAPAQAVISEPAAELNRRRPQSRRERRLLRREAQRKKRMA